MALDFSINMMFGSVEYAPSGSEYSSNKVSAITPSNSNSNTAYPSVYALVQYLTANYKNNPQLAQFVQDAITIAITGIPSYQGAFDYYGTQAQITALSELEGTKTAITADFKRGNFNGTQWTFTDLDPAPQAGMWCDIYNLLDYPITTENGAIVGYHSGVVRVKQDTPQDTPAFVMLENETNYPDGMSIVFDEDGQLKVKDFKYLMKTDRVANLTGSFNNINNIALSGIYFVQDADIYKGILIVSSSGQDDSLGSAQMWLKDDGTINVRTYNIFDGNGAQEGWSAWQQIGGSEVVNNLITTDETKALSAAMGANLEVRSRTIRLRASYGNSTTCNCLIPPAFLEGAYSGNMAGNSTLLLSTINKYNIELYFPESVLASFRAAGGNRIENMTISYNNGITGSASTTIQIYVTLFGNALRGFSIHTLSSSEIYLVKTDSYGVWNISGKGIEAFCGASDMRLFTYSDTSLWSEYVEVEGTINGTSFKINGNISPYNQYKFNGIIENAQIAIDTANKRISLINLKTITVAGSSYTQVSGVSISKLIRTTHTSLSKKLAVSIAAASASGNIYGDADSIMCYYANTAFNFRYPLRDFIQYREAERRVYQPSEGAGYHDENDNPVQTGWYVLGEFSLNEMQSYEYQLWCRIEKNVWGITDLDNYNQNTEQAACLHLRATSEYQDGNYNSNDGGSNNRKYRLELLGGYNWRNWARYTGITKLGFARNDNRLMVYIDADLMPKNDNTMLFRCEEYNSENLLYIYDDDYFLTAENNIEWDERFNSIVEAIDLLTDRPLVDKETTALKLEQAPRPIEQGVTYPTGTKFIVDDTRKPFADSIEPACRYYEMPDVVLDGVTYSGCRFGFWTNGNTYANDPEWCNVGFFEPDPDNEGYYREFKMYHDFGDGEYNWVQKLINPFENAQITWYQGQKAGNPLDWLNADGSYQNYSDPAMWDFCQRDRRGMVQNPFPMLFDGDPISEGSDFDGDIDIDFDFLTDIKVYVEPKGLEDLPSLLRYNTNENHQCLQINLDGNGWVDMPTVDEE